VASARLALPIEVARADLTGAPRGLPTYRQSVNFPNPWQGGTWRLRDIVDYEMTAVRGLLDAVRKYREGIVRGFEEMGRRAVDAGRRGGPFAFVIPEAQHDPLAATKLLDVLIGGHVEVQDFATLGGFSGVHQFCRVGAHAFMGGGTVATRDVAPFSLTVGNRARFFGLNVVGLRRRGFSPEAIAALRQAYRLLTQGGLPLAEALRRLDADGPHSDEVRAVVDFVRSSRRGVVLDRRHGARAGGAEL